MLKTFLILVQCFQLCKAIVQTSHVSTGNIRALLTSAASKQPCRLDWTSSTYYRCWLIQLSVASCAACCGDSSVKQT